MADFVTCYTRNMFLKTFPMDRFFTLSESVIAIRSKYYVSVLLHRLGIKIVAHIAPALEEMSDAKNAGFYSKRRSEFYRYRDGGNIKNMALVSSVDGLLPGTARIIRHPIWPLLSMRTTQEEDLIDLAQMINPGLLQHILNYDEDTCAINFRSFSKDQHWYKSGSQFLQAIDRRGLDELAVLLIAIETHEARGEYMISYRLRELVRCFFVEISFMVEFDQIIAQLYREVHGVLADVPSCRAYDNEVFFMFAQMLSLDGPEHMLRIIENVSSNRMSHRGQYSSILRSNRSI